MGAVRSYLDPCQILLGSQWDPTMTSAVENLKKIFVLSCTWIQVVVAKSDWDPSGIRV